MTFPTLTSTSSGECAAGTTRTMNLPASIASGNLLLAMSAVGTGESHTWPAGWTEMIDSGGLSIARRTADGSEGATIDVTTSNLGSRASIYNIFRFTGGVYKTPELNSASFTNTSAADPPNLSPTFGALDTMWIAATMHNNRGSVVGVFPTNYADNQTELRSTIELLGGGIKFATRNLNAASENPDNSWGVLGHAGIAFTIAIALQPPAIGRSFIPGYMM